MFPAGQALSPPKPQADERLFPQISQHAGWDAVALKPESHPLKTFPPALHGLKWE